VEHIFDYVVVLSRASKIWPAVVTTNRKFGYTTPTWSRGSEDDKTIKTLRIKCKDKKGKHILLRRLEQPAIDTTFLRTCKAFYNIGSPMLYGYHTYCISMRSIEGIESSKYGDIEYRPPPFMPTTEIWQEEIREGLKQISQ
jgi:hypothetical protein